MKKIQKCLIYKEKDGTLYMPKSRVNIQEEYKPLIKEFSNFFKKIKNKKIQTVYLRGSLVWGLGLKNISDADFFIITSKKITEKEKNKIKEYTDKLNKKYLFVTKFDIRYFTLNEVLSAKENILIKLTGVLIHGEDIKDKLKNPKPGREVSISLDLLEMEILRTKNEVKNGIYNEKNTKAMCLWIMKRIVRSGLELVSEREGCFTRDLELCLEIFSKYYPKKRNSMTKALSLAFNPTNDLKKINEAFDEIGVWIIQEMKRINSILPDKKEINKILDEKIKSLFSKERIICLLRYGPKEKFNKDSPEDFDFLLLLNKYEKKDYKKISLIKKMNLPIEVFIDYKDQIIEKGIENYQRGRHGSYFFKILSSAETIIGNNYYKENQNKLNEDKINSDLLYRIEEYFYRIQKNIINTNKIKKSEIQKYLGRILTDLMLVKKEIKFQDMHKYHYTHILQDKLKPSKIISENTKDLIINFNSDNKVNIELIGEILGELYKEYLKIRKE